MNAVEEVLWRLADGEERLADTLIAISDRHRDEHEIHHVARDLERWSREHAQRLTVFLDRYPNDSGAALPAPGGPAGVVEDPGSPGRNRWAHPGLQHLRDLRIIYVCASDNSLLWEMLAQAAQAQRDTDLLNLSSQCRPQTLRQTRWANTQIKTLSPQILTSQTPR